MKVETILTESIELTNKGPRGILFYICVNLVLFVLGVILLSAGMNPQQRAMAGKLILQTQIKQVALDKSSAAAAQAERKEMARSALTLFKENAAVASLAFLLFLTAWFWLSAGTIYYYNEILHDGNPGIPALLAAARLNLPSISAALILYFLILAVTAGVPLLSMILFNKYVTLLFMPALLKTVILFTLIVIVVVMIGVAGWLSIRLAFASTAVVVGSLGPVKALKESFEIARGYWWKIFWVIVCMSIAGRIIETLVLKCTDAAARALIVPGQISYAFWGLHMAVYYTMASYVALVMLCSCIYMYNGIKLEKDEAD